MKTAAIILAAGKGTRMYQGIKQNKQQLAFSVDTRQQKKQYMHVAGYPIVYYALKAFEQAGVDQLILVTGAEDVEYCRNEIVEKYHIERVTHILAGGKERYDSVMAGLEAVDPEVDYLLIHDGARPCVSRKVIERCLEDVQKYKTAVAAVPVKDTIKRGDQAGFAVDTPNRSELYQVQTPQTFALALIRQAYENMKQEKEAVGITDDAMVVERYTDTRIRLTEGDYRNIKVTTPEDLMLAEVFLSLKEQ